MRWVTDPPHKTRSMMGLRADWTASISTICMCLWFMFDSHKFLYLHFVVNLRAYVARMVCPLIHKWTGIYSIDMSPWFLCIAAAWCMTLDHRARQRLKGSLPRNIIDILHACSSNIGPKRQAGKAHNPSCGPHLTHMTMVHFGRNVCRATRRQRKRAVFVRHTPSKSNNSTGRIPTPFPDREPMICRKAKCVRVSDCVRYVGNKCHMSLDAVTHSLTHSADHQFMEITCDGIPAHALAFA